MLDYLVEPAFASTFTVLPEHLSRAFVLATIQYMFSGFRLSAFHGGNGLLTQTLASKLRVRTGAEVARIAQSADGATVTLADGETLAADAVVIATPGNHVARLCDTLTDDERRFFGGVQISAGEVAP
ncbi:MAG: FAD-dependent oxidoreductase [Bacteroidota bacterium]